jgi:hypothetical protein
MDVHGIAGMGKCACMQHNKKNLAMEREIEQVVNMLCLLSLSVSLQHSLGTGRQHKHNEWKKFLQTENMSSTRIFIDTYTQMFRA